MSKEPEKSEPAPAESDSEPSVDNFAQENLNEIFMEAFETDEEKPEVPL